jgi:hypothetical protein
MNKRNGRLLLGLTCGAVLALSVPAKAAYVSGTLNMTGGFTETATSLLFCTTAGIPCASTPTGTLDTNSPAGNSGTGDFVTGGPYANDPNGVVITNLNSTIAPVGTVLPGNGIALMTFNSSPTLLTPDIEFFAKEVMPGTGTSAACTTGIGTCTPTGSAVTFTNLGGNASTASIVVVGEAERISTGQFDPMTLTLSAPFSSPYQAELSTFNTTGSISSSLAATFIVTPPSATPEPMTSVLMGSGLLVFGIMLRRKRRA